jgi:DNA-binding sugar fermentation-stimulating protein
MVLFVVQREDARLVKPNPVTDPGFALALSEARGAGVLLRAARFRLSASGRATWLGPLPVRTGTRR